jgi:general secretion pathway protein C
MSARWWTFIVWALAAASALAWGLKLFVRPPPAPPQALVVGAAGPPRGDLTRLLGADPPPVAAVAAPEPAADARFQLVGVVSPRSPQAVREGLALIAVDGKPPRAYRVGAVVDGPHVLQGVEARGATLGPRDGTPAVSLKLPPPAAAATGVLPPARPGGAVPAPRPPGVATLPAVPGRSGLNLPQFAAPPGPAPTAEPQDGSDASDTSGAENVQPPAVNNNRATLR